MTLQMQLEFTPQKPWRDMTVAECMIRMLRESKYVTTDDFLDAGLYTFRNRKSEINRDANNGLFINKRPIEGKSIFEYWLEEDRCTENRGQGDLSI